MSSQIAKLAALPLAKHLKRGASEHKGSAGKVLLIGGAHGMAGALLLAYFYAMQHTPYTAPRGL